MTKLTIGVDIAKSVFHLVFMNATGRVLRKKKLKRYQMIDFFTQTEPSVIVIEACGSSHYWSRELTEAGMRLSASLLSM